MPILHIDMWYQYQNAAYTHCFLNGLDTTVDVIIYMYTCNSHCMLIAAYICPCTNVEYLWAAT